MENNLSSSEALHHEVDPAEKLDQEAHFSAKLRSLIDSSHRKELALADCVLERLEEAGKIKEKF